MYTVQYLINYSWYHFLSLYLFINKCAELENCCASLAIRSVLSSSWLSLSPRSSISWCALLTSDEADVARVFKSCKFAFGPGMCLAIDLFAFPLDSPTGDRNKNILVLKINYFSVRNSTISTSKPYTYIALRDPSFEFHHRKVPWKSSPLVLLAFLAACTAHQACYYIDYCRQKNMLIG